MDTKQPRYWDKFHLLNKSEQTLFQRLKDAAPALHVFPQVSMSQIFYGASQNRYLQVAHVGRKSIDFLVCRVDTSIVLAIELNGPTHEKKRQRIRDEKKKRALEDAGIPLVIFDPASIPTVAAIRREIAPHIVERKHREVERDKRLQRSPLD